MLPSTLSDFVLDDYRHLIPASLIFSLISRTLELSGLLLAPQGQFEAIGEFRLGSLLLIRARINSSAPSFLSRISIRESSSFLPPKSIRRPSANPQVPNYRYAVHIGYGEEPGKPDTTKLGKPVRTNARASNISTLRSFLLAEGELCCSKAKRSWNHSAGRRINTKLECPFPLSIDGWQRIIRCTTPRIIPGVCLEARRGAVGCT